MSQLAASLERYPGLRASDLDSPLLEMTYLVIMQQQQGQGSVIPDSVPSSARVDAAGSSLWAPVSAGVLEHTARGLLCALHPGDDSSSGSVASAADALSGLAEWGSEGGSLPLWRRLLLHQPASPLWLRAAYRCALRAGDYTAALDAGMALFDHGYGTGLLGATPTAGAVTPMGLLTGPLARALLDPVSGRAAELLIAAASAPSVGGSALGRSLHHYAALQRAATELHFRHWQEALDAVAECLRVSQSQGDARGAALALELQVVCVQRREQCAAEEHAQRGTGAAAAAACVGRRRLESVRQTVSLYRSASDQGMWRLQARCALRLVALGHRTDEASPSSANAPAASAAASAAAGPSVHAAPVSVPVHDWLSVDPLVSYRPGGLGLGAQAAAVAVGAFDVAPDALNASTATGNGSARSLLHPSAAVLSVGAVAAASPATATAFSGVTATMAGAAAKRTQALASCKRRPSLGAVGAPLSLLADPGAPVVPLAGSPSIWSTPVPLDAEDILALQREGHLHREAQWRKHGLDRLARASRRCAALADPNADPMALLFP